MFVLGRYIACSSWQFSFKPYSIYRRFSMSLEGKVKIAVVQLTSKEDKEGNFEIARGLVEKAARDGAKMAFLPECFDMICPSKKLTIERSEPLNGTIIGRYRELAKREKVWLSLGGFHERCDNPKDRRVLNSHIILNDQGEIASIYRKVHLFNLDIPGTRLVESEFSQPGSMVVKPAVTPAGRVGMGICYDVRFAEFAISLAKAGADVLTYPSSFTVPTGKAHWETLLKCRAVETQCYLVAAAQTGQHNEKRSSYGHSMIIDPWGVILAELADEKPGYAVAEIDFEHLRKVRQRLPVWTDRKPELYGNIIPASGEYLSNKPQFNEDFQFGEQAVVKTYQIFCKTLHSIAFVNHRPVLPGHVLVSPLRQGAKRMADLNQAEIFDLFYLVQRVQKAVETIHEASSSTVAIQDGIEAGQSIDHLHVHVLPRKKSDFGGNIDEIYRRLQQHDKPNSEFKEMKLLSPEEMNEQCKVLRENV